MCASFSFWKPKRSIGLGWEGFLLGMACAKNGKSSYGVINFRANLVAHPAGEREGVEMSKKKPAKTYPDVSQQLAAYAAYRRKRAALSWEEKVAIIERMKEDLYPWRQRRLRSDGRGKQPKSRG